MMLSVFAEQSGFRRVSLPYIKIYFQDLVQKNRYTRKWSIPLSDHLLGHGQLLLTKVRNVHETFTMCG